MSDFLDAALSPLPLVFAVPLLICLVLLAISALSGFDADGALDGPLEGVGDAIGATGVPPLLIGTAVSLIAWVVATIVQIVIVEPLDGGAAVAGGILGGLIAASAGFSLGGRAVRPLGRAMVTATAPNARDLVGHEAVIRSGRVDTSFGYADATWDDGTQSRVEVRDADTARSYRPGDRVRLVSFDPDDGTFAVAPEGEIFPDRALPGEEGDPGP